MAHTTALERLCRVCGKSTSSEYDESLRSVFGVDTTEDSPTAHPQVFCHACKIVLRKAHSEGYKHRTVVFEHDDDSCSVCQHFKSNHYRKEATPKKAQHMTGRPHNDSRRYCIQHIRDVAPPAFNVRTTYWCSNLWESPSGWSRRVRVSYLLWYTSTPGGSGTSRLLYYGVCRLLAWVQYQHQLPVLSWWPSVQLQLHSTSISCDSEYTYKPMCCLWQV